MIQYNLYGSEGCHLCEEALGLCQQIIPAEQLNEIDIVDQDTVPHESKTLVELYGVHIPVIEQLNTDSSQQNEKLFWPFTLEQLIQLTQQS